jgi:hypothetical protein
MQDRSLFIEAHRVTEKPTEYRLPVALSAKKCFSQTTFGFVCANTSISLGELEILVAGDAVALQELTESCQWAAR